MKYKVIGWTNALNNEIEEIDYSIATYNVIYDEVLKNKYRFTGCTHQNHNLGVPVLNDGKKRTFSEREWGGLMASIHQDFDYVTYAYADFDDVITEVLPDASLEIKGKVLNVENNLYEELIIKVDEETFNQALSELVIHEFKNQNNRYLEVSDTVTIISMNQQKSFIVKDIREGYNVSVTNKITPNYYEDLWSECLHANEERKAQIRQIFAKGMDIITIYLKEKGKE